MAMTIGPGSTTNLPPVTNEPLPNQAQVLADTKALTPLKTTATGAVDVLGNLATPTADSGAVATGLLEGAPSEVNTQTFAQIAEGVNIDTLKGASLTGALGEGVQALSDLPSPDALLRVGSAFPELNGALDNLTLDFHQSATLTATLNLGSTLATPPGLTLNVDKNAISPLIQNATKTFFEVAQKSTSTSSDTTVEAKLNQGEVVIPDSTVLSFESSASAILGAMDGADIGALVFLVMQEASKDNDLDLKSMMAEMKSVTETKKALREYQGWLQGVKAAWKKSALQEYQTRQANGTSPPTESFEQFCSGLQMTLPTQSFTPNSNLSKDGQNGGNANQPAGTLPNPDTLPFDFSTYKSPGQIQMENEKIQKQMDAAAANGVGDVPPLDKEKCLELAKKYGISPTDVNQFWTFYMVHGGPDKLGDFDAWLTKGSSPPDNPMDGAGLTVGSGTAMCPENEAKIDAFCARVSELGATKQKETDGKVEDLKKLQAEIGDWKNMSEAERKDKLKQILDKGENADLMKALGANNTDEAVSSLYNKIDDIVMTELRYQQALKENPGLQDKYKTALDQKIKDLKDMLSKATPEAQAICGLLVQSRCDSLANQFQGDKDLNRWRSCGGTDVIGGSAEGGSGDVGDYDVAVDAFGEQKNPVEYTDPFTGEHVSYDAGFYADPKALAGTIEDLKGWASGGMPGFGSPDSLATKAAGEYDQKITDAQKEGGQADVDFGNDWKNDRAARKQGTPEDLFAAAPVPGSEIASNLQVGGVQTDGKTPFMQLANATHPYDVETVYKTVSFDQLDAEIDHAKGMMDSMSEMSEEMSMRLQMKMDAKNKLSTALSNILSKLEKTGDSLTQNLK